MVKIVSWNINSVKARLQHLLSYLAEAEAAEIILLQEIKCTNEHFPYQEIEDMGYNIAVHGQKSYNGVAILAKFPLEDISTHCIQEDEHQEARYIEAVISIQHQALRVASVYVPNGKDIGHERFKYKLTFFDALRSHLQKLLTYEEILVVGGDYNVAPYLAVDVYDEKHLDGQICCHKEERKKWRQLLELGLVDAYMALYPSQQQFTWWDYRGGSWQHNKGMRIDHLLLSPEATDLLSACAVDTYMRDKEKPSDHAPIWCQLDMK